MAEGGASVGGVCLGEVSKAGFLSGVGEGRCLGRGG